MEILSQNLKKKIKNYTKSKHAIAFNSGTAALHVAIKASNVKEGTETIAPTLTFIATINAIIYNNCFPIFMDCDDFFNIDSKKILAFLKNETFQKNGKTFNNKKTKKNISALIVTHVWGNAANLKDLKKEGHRREV